jgi:hypothetical protein
MAGVSRDAAATGCIDPDAWSLGGRQHGIGNDHKPAAEGYQVRLAVSFVQAPVVRACGRLALTNTNLNRISSSPVTLVADRGGGAHAAKQRARPAPAQSWFF